jgi:zinc transport system substrate-binding protein
MIFALIVAAVLLTTGRIGFCSPAPDKGEGEKSSKNIKIVATVFPVYDFTRAVVGDAANLSMLVRPGVEIHTYDPSPQDILSIHNADVFIYVGGESDAWVDVLLGSSELAGKTVLRLIDRVDAVEEELVEGMQPEEEEEGEEGEEEEEYDEHIWTSPRNAMTLVRSIAETLCQVDPKNAETYRANAKGYIDEIAKIDEEFKALVASAKRKKIVFGDRFPFRYFADEFGLEYRAAFPGCHTESDVSAATMAYLVKAVQNESIPVVYTIELSSQNIAKAIAEQTGAEVVTLHSCHTVTRTEFESGVTWLSLMKGNVESLRKGLN